MSIRLTGYTINRIVFVMTTVLALQAYRDWFDSLTDQEATAVQNVVHKLELEGLNLGTPHCSAIKGAAMLYANCARSKVGARSVSCTPTIPSAKRS